MRALNLLLAVALLLFLAACGGSPIDRDLGRDGVHVADLEVGNGPVAARDDHVVLNIATWIYADGAKGQPMEHFGAEPFTAQLRPGTMMPGLLDAIIGMSAGSKRLVVIAPEQITPRFRPESLMREESLWCEVELLAVQRVTTEDLAVGDGETVDEGDYVEIDYTAWHADSLAAGRGPYASSEADGQPARLLVGAGMVNEGLDFGLAGMKVGGKRRITVPPSLGYGDAGQDEVPGGATLVYEVAARRIMGVGIETLRAGQGGTAAPGRRVKFHITGWFRQPDGSKGEMFQDSRETGNPFTAMVGQFKLQPGIELGLRGMREGELRRLDVPSELALGSRGLARGPRTLVPPDTDVIYEIELIEVTGR